MGFVLLGVAWSSGGYVYVSYHHPTHPSLPHTSSLVTPRFYALTTLLTSPPPLRTDKSQTPADKVRVVEELLAADKDNNKEEEPGMRHTADTTRGAPNATTQKAEISSIVRD